MYHIWFKGILYTIYRYIAYQILYPLTHESFNFTLLVYSFACTEYIREALKSILGEMPRICNTLTYAYFCFQFLHKRHVVNWITLLGNRFVVKPKWRCTIAQLNCLLLSECRFCDKEVNICVKQNEAVV